jgi:hypothetical protein
MSSAIIKIAPISVEITEIKIYLDYSLNSNARIHYALIHSNGIPYNQGTITLTEEEFAAWGTDDNYIEDLVLNKLNLQRA